MLPEFKTFNKIARLSRDIIITEKIDGTNGLIYITPDLEKVNPSLRPYVKQDIYVGSRNRWLNEHNDNHGFYHWVMENKEELLKLGPGYHYGEWWGNGIQRGYNLPKGEKRFSLFNTGRWIDSIVLKEILNPEYHSMYLAEKQKINKNINFCPECCYVVPILYEGIFDTTIICGVLTTLKLNGSKASPDFMNPEGIVIYHKKGNVYFKKTILNDEKGKGDN